MLRARVTISLPAYDIVWESENLQDKHPTLSIPSYGETYQDRLDVQRRAWQELEGLGLARNGKAHPDLVDTFHMLERPQREFYGWFSAPNGEGQRAALSAASGDDAVLAEIIDEKLVLTPLRPTGLIDALVSVLPDKPAARGQSFNFPADSVGDGGGGGRSGGRHSRPEDDGGGFMTSSRGSGGPSPQRLKEIMDKPRTGGGQLFVAARDRLGSRKRAESPLTFIDNTDGRYLGQKMRGPDGSQWVIVAPADKRTLAQKLSEMAASVTGR
ncbi:ESX secretion-associated protein EspG [Crossiella sp. CA-258035]|uniref:ESX secretion-associated protein EspG n=1 Tax=Crossiella sp. CA-258035 TaxID=2981138 RepID=UPI0024BCCA75|nr:ESX secretion-associated protein EspG [Crossiella sp. CA-258035]WHT20758.1 ESX secretion-associated protein EspG [Crossiella sp. CA-258035]